ncbi:GntR family transcriptional regulator [Azorhizobium oxalatiphilum]|uniref:GntR family transcriptional regulator n=1 Tax=Azorhizobium oxalatiphilum TaxID=980631 RepID=A0A917CIL2_9HYPH|nr:PLP-dependent aminotransferase family protein [Azorhizobium oxalatiphilum]GGF87702.1 GntR family transcriptional regulator [Azorhizobium oxalatiphilum]
MKPSDRTNLSDAPDWSALIPVLPLAGPRPAALYGELRRLIESGVPPGTKLPPTRELATRLGVSRGAAVAAFEMLLAEGFAEARVGAGTYVAQAVPQMLPIPAAPTADVVLAPALPGGLGIAAPDTRTFQLLRGLLARQLAAPARAHFAYGDPRGNLALRQEVAAYLRAARGVRCHAEQIVLTSGSQQALDLVIRAALKPGDPVWIEDPCYPMARAAFTGAGMQLVGVPVDGEGLDPAAGEERASEAKAVYVTPSHQFPLGVTLTMARRLALIDWARRAGAWIIEDDYDSEFRYAGPPLTAMQGMDPAGRVIYVGTFSKALFPGLRMGYVVVPEPLLAAVIDVRNRADRYPPTLMEQPLADFLHGGHFSAHLRRARRRARDARDALLATLSEAGLPVLAPDQGLHLLLTRPDWADDTVLVRRAHAVGFGPRALSALHVDAPRRQGLVIGFSGFPPEELAAAARRWAAAREG